jgi:hypothetical protein
MPMHLNDVMDTKTLNDTADTFTEENGIKLARGHIVRIEEDQYHEALMDSYDANPLISAIPPLGDEKSVINILANAPDWKPIMPDNQRTAAP